MKRMLEDLEQCQDADDLLELLARRYDDETPISNNDLAEEYRYVICAAKELYERTVTQGKDIPSDMGNMVVGYADRDADAGEEVRVVPQADDGLGGAQPDGSPLIEDDGFTTEYVSPTGRLPREPEFIGFDPASSPDRTVVMTEQGPVDYTDIEARALALMGVPEELLYGLAGKTLPVTDPLKLAAKEELKGYGVPITYPVVWSTKRGWWGQRNEQADITGPWRNEKAARLAIDCRYQEAHRANGEAPHEGF